jgi:hypothetical protein
MILLLLDLNIYEYMNFSFTDELIRVILIVTSKKLGITKQALTG